MYDTYREHCDHEFGCMSEQQNALAISRLQLPADDSEMIAEFIKLGKFVVVAQIETFCPLTDAFIGDRRMILDHFDNKNDAENYLRTCDEHVHPTILH